MVIIEHEYPEHTLQAYSTVPLTPELNASFHHDFNIGSFARFGQPFTAFELHDKPSFHGLSHVNIRVALDAEGISSDVILIDDNAIANHAIWWILSTAQSKSETDFAHPIIYPDEPFTLWQVLILTQQFSSEYVCERAGGPFRSLLEPHHYPLYDPHSPQLPPFNDGVDYSNKSQADGYLHARSPAITANFDEVEWTDDQEIINRWWWPLIPPPFFVPFLVRLTPGAATEAGLVSGWALSSPRPEEWDPKPAPGMVFRFRQEFAWDSPKWGPAPVPGSAGVVKDNAVRNATAQAASADAIACAKVKTVSNCLCGAAGGRGYADFPGPTVQPVDVS